jgi:integrase
MPLERLSARAVQSAKPTGKTRLLADGGSLYLRIGAVSGKSWIFRYRSGDRQHDLGLGPFPDISLAEARERATAQRRLRLNGDDPIAVRRTQRQRAALVTTFADCAEAYISAHELGWRSPRQAPQWRSSLGQYAYPVFGSLPVADVDLPLVLKVIEPLWKGKTETANRVRRRIESVLDYATTRGHRSGDNPARWRGHIENILPERSKVQPTERHPALPYREIGAFMTKLKTLDTVGARALELTILTAARAGETIGARWSEIDMVARLWVVPADRMKTGREHRVPISDRALAILQQMAEIRTGDYAFPGRYGDCPLGHGTMRDQLARLGRDDLTVHGFRSTFASWAADRTNYPHEVREMALAHTVGSAVERAYQRSDLFDRRARLMQDWATFCAAPAATGGVVAIRG